ncbi:MAG: calcium/sodium antiporter [Lachnospiraceae bacterium]|nr:calcium/sodium antiporter [Lachnospiraceae bacterium]
MMYLLLLIGFVLLIKGADLFVDGSSSIAGILKVPSVIIGLTIVAMGTSAPEAAVSINAGLAGNSDISLGNIVGSNIFNLLVVIGACAVIFPANANEDILKRDLWWNIGVSVLLLITIMDGNLSRLEGIIFLAVFIFYLGLMVRSAMKNRIEETPMDVLPLWKSLLFVVIGLAAVVFGGDLVVDNASLIAKTWGMSDTLVGLTIVAIGTSLPELVTSITASKKGDSGIALGNAVGSCLFNILFILGMASTLTPINAVPELIIDTAILIVVTILILVVAKTGKKTNRVEGIICVAAYIIYTAYIIMR